MRLFIVSNRLPFTVKEEKGKVQFLESSGGLVTGLSAYLDSLKGSSFTKLEYVWVGWAGTSISQKLENDVRARALQDFDAYPVFIQEKTMDNFYHGFCNRTIWPLFHSFPVYASYEENYWESYEEVNEVFCWEILRILKPEDVLWIHDYHLMLLPALIREKIPRMSIGFFLHIPFPSYEIYRLLHKTWRVRILEGLLGSDLIGFHTHDYAQHFLRCVLRILGYEHNIGEIPFNERVVKADTFPMGIHYDKYHGSTSNQEVQAEKDVLKQQFYPLKLVLSVDRLDYTKGIINRLQGYELFLERNPEWRKKISLLLIVVPSRIGVDNYRRMKKQIDEMVGRVNGKYSDIGWMPIVYQFKHLSFPQLTALYNSCDIALITPLRDGMNLVAKEYVAARTDATGVIILSEMAGAAKELGEAIIINPYHRQEIADALREALEMPCEEQRRRIEAMQSRLKRYDVIHWVDDFLQSLNNVAEQKRDLEARLLPPAERRQIIREFKTAAVKIVFLDYDGTLVPFVGQPGNAQPDPDLLQTLEELARYPGTDVVLISGRDTDTLEQWFGTLHITLVAEHGVWVKEEGAEWQLLKPLTSEWKAQLMPIIQCYVERLPGSFMEEKGFSVVWHFRNAEPELASVRAKELMDDLITFTANTDVQVLQGSKVIEVRNAGINKGVAGTHFLSRREYDLILAVGDDWTDEDLFKVIPQRQNNYTLKVGITPSNASYNLKDYKETRKLLEEMIR